MRIGIVLNLTYFIAIILLREKVVDYIYLIGLLYGLEEGFYFSVYNMFESDGVSNKERTKFTGTYSAVQSLFGILFPTIFGVLIYQNGFIESISVALVIVSLMLLLSFQFKDRNLPKSKTTDLKEYEKIVATNENIMQAHKVNFFSGLVYSQGAMASIVTIFIVKVFSNSFSLGIFTSVFGILSCLLGLLFAKCIKPKHYTSMIGFSMTFTILSLITMVFYCSPVTVILFNFFQTVSKGLTDLINTTSQSNVSNMAVIKKEYKVEYFLAGEFSLVVGRVLSQSLFIMMAFVGSEVMIFVFIVLMIVFAYQSIQLQKCVNRTPIVEEKNAVKPLSLEVIIEE